MDTSRSFLSKVETLLAAGIAPGPKLGQVLAALEDWWVASDFIPSKQDLLARSRPLQGLRTHDTGYHPDENKGPGCAKAEKGKPDPARLLSGKRLTETWNHFEGERWQAVLRHLGIDTGQGASQL